MAITLTQTQIIQSLGEALTWFERELAWGVPAAELRHLTGRIGELFAAMVTRGQMALEVNQKGYDVVSAEGDRISVKTVTSRHNITFNTGTLDQAHRIMVLLLVDDPDKGLNIQELIDEDTATFRQRLSAPRDGKQTLYLSRPALPTSDRLLKITDVATFEDYTLSRFENGSIRVVRDGVDVKPAKAALRAVAARLGVRLETESGQVKTTHQLGSHVIKALSS